MVARKLFDIISTAQRFPPFEISLFFLAPQSSFVAFDIVVESAREEKIRMI